MGVDSGLLKAMGPELELLLPELDERSRRMGGMGVEILNFAIPGHGPGQRWAHFSREGWQYEPDFLLYEATLADLGWDERRLRGLCHAGSAGMSPITETSWPGPEPGQEGRSIFTKTC